MFLLASFIAPKVAARFSGKFTLFTSMLLVSILIILSFSLTIFAIFSFAFEASFDFLYFIFGIVILNLITYIFSPLILKITYGIEENDEVQEIVDNVKKKLNYKGKLIGVIARNFPYPNAFAFGNFIFGKYVAVTESMLKLTNKKELEAVIGHEIGHHMHKDNAIMLLFGLLPSILYYLGYFLIVGRREEERSTVLMIVGFFSVIISFLVQILVLAFSRLREYFADLEGARASGKENMQSALVKLHNYYKSAKSALSGEIGKTLFIYAFTQTLANPMVSMDTIEKIKSEEINPLEEFLSTHPPIPKRLKFLDTLPY